MVLRPVASSEAITAHLADLLKKAEKAPTDKTKSVDPSTWDSLDIQHHKQWSEARVEHRRQTQELAEYRRESLATSHRARISLLEDQLQQATNEKIQKMHQSQIRSAEADYARHIQDLDIAMERADVTAEPVAYGVIIIEAEVSDAE